MSNQIRETKAALSVLVQQALDKAVQQGKLPEQCAGVCAQVEIPKDKGNGDFASTVCMRLAKPAKMAPRAIAEILTDGLNGPDIEKVEIAGPGFINFYMKPEWLYQPLADIDREQEQYGRTDLGKGQKVMVEFISANPTGPMHVGNARGGAIGDVLAAALDWSGYDVCREFYVNDAGNQIEKFGNSLEARYLQHFLGEDKVPFPEDGYHGADITQMMEEYIGLYGDQHLEEDSEMRRKALVDYSLKRNLEKMEKTMKDFRIYYDVWFRESSLYESGEVQKTIDDLTKLGYTYEKEGAVWLAVTKFGGEKDEVLVRNNGIPTYFAADIAYHRNKFVTRGFDRVIDVWGADHHGHTARMKGAMEVLSIDPDRLVFVLMQLVRLIRDGEVVRVSKRTGKAHTLNDLLEETGTDAARFFFNMRSPSSHFDFDLDLAVEQSNENPVYYVQYAHARICSIISLLAGEGISVPDFSEIDPSLLCEKEEMEVLKLLMQFPEELAAVGESLDPSRITKYTIDLASAFHSFYNACRVKNDDRALTLARLKLIDCVRTVIRNGLTVLGVTCPEHM